MITFDKPNPPQSRLTNLPVLFTKLNLDKLDDASQATIAAIDAILPQTQCGLCGHHDGCLPYAHGIVTQGEAINLCVPGGQATTDAIAAITGRDGQTATPSKHPLDPTTNRPTEVRAVIREADCIGCTKCIPACPVDAIIGTAKHMHSIVSDLCTGCELCIAPCPVDCIELVAHARTLDESARTAEQNHLRHRYHQHLHRIAKTIESGSKPVVSTIESAMVNALNTAQSPNIDQQTAKNTIAAAKLRSQIKKLTKQLAVKDDAKLREQLSKLQQELAQLE
ncbi:RnfABCDGE type electron transport complex subunit B [Moraxella sp. ZJ142]|uniref:RnfABCDGE type electron transport complex subunit B n=1 Tax=Moraxella marmotae TaxID=3344520 RepID=UPI0035D3FCFC